MAIDYISRQDVDDYMKEKELPLDNADVGVKERKITLAIKMTEAEINKFLKQGGYKAPLTTQEEVDSIIDLTLPVFKYHLLSDQGARTDQVVNDYTYARSMLKKIASNDLTLYSIEQVDEGSDGIQVIKMDFI